jgi:hypothetical protein
MQLWREIETALEALQKRDTKLVTIPFIMNNGCIFIRSDKSRRSWPPPKNISNEPLGKRQLGFEDLALAFLAPL